MKCICINCRGKGVITCEDCSGIGKVNESIEAIDLDVVAAEHKHYDELAALKADTKRLRASHAELCKLTPSRRASYDAQLAGALEAVEKQAEKLWKDK